MQAQRQRQLDGPEVGRKVPTHARDVRDDELAQFLSELRQLSVIERPDVLWRVNTVQEPCVNKLH